MIQLDSTLTTLIQTYNAGSVVSVNDDDTPAVSPQATFVVVDNATIAFGHSRFLNTTHRFQQRPQTDINFIDVLMCRAAWVAGTVRIAQRGYGYCRSRFGNIVSLRYGHRIR